MSNDFGIIDKIAAEVKQGHDKETIAASLHLNSVQRAILDAYMDGATIRTVEARARRLAARGLRADEAAVVHLIERGLAAAPSTHLVRSGHASTHSVRSGQGAKARRIIAPDGATPGPSRRPQRAAQGRRREGHRRRAVSR